MKIDIIAHSHDCVNAGDFPEVADYLAIGMPDLGQSIEHLFLEPHFHSNSPRESLLARAEDFHKFQKTLPKVIFSRRNKNLTLRYNCDIGSAEDVEKLGRVVNSHDIQPGSVSFFHSFLEELAERLKILEKHLKSEDHPKVALFRAHIIQREQELSRLPDVLKSQLADARERSRAINLKAAKEKANQVKPALPEMSDKQFWSLISNIQPGFLLDGNQADAISLLEKRLERLAPDAIVAFQKKLDEKLRALDTKEHFSYAKRAQTDDSFLYVRAYVVGMGEEFYLKTLKEPQFMPSGWEDFEQLLNLASCIWAKLTSDEPSNFPD